MARTIEFDVERIFRRLTVLEGTQIKYAAKRSLQRFGFEAQQHLGLQMAGTCPFAQEIIAGAETEEIVQRLAPLWRST